MNKVSEIILNRDKYSKKEVVTAIKAAFADMKLLTKEANRSLRAFVDELRINNANEAKKIFDDYSKKTKKV